jgi:hypothetical protein
MFLFSLQLEIKNKHVPRDSVNHKGHRTMPTPEQPYTPDLSLSARIQNQGSEHRAHGFRDNLMMGLTYPVTVTQPRSLRCSVAAVLFLFLSVCLRANKLRNNESSRSCHD